MSQDRPVSSDAGRFRAFGARGELREGRKDALGGQARPNATGRGGMAGARGPDRHQKRQHFDQHLKYLEG